MSKLWTLVIAMRNFLTPGDNDTSAIERVLLGLSKLQYCDLRRETNELDDDGCSVYDGSDYDDFYE